MVQPSPETLASEENAITSPCLRKIYTYPAHLAVPYEKVPLLGHEHSYDLSGPAQ